MLPSGHVLHYSVIYNPPTPIFLTDNYVKQFPIKNRNSYTAIYVIVCFECLPTTFQAQIFGLLEGT